MKNENKITSIVHASYTGHTKDLRKFAIDQGLAPIERVANMHDGEIEKLINKDYIAMYVINSSYETLPDMETFYLLPRKWVEENAKIISR